jgi:hypothetical protein
MAQPSYDAKSEGQVTNTTITFAHTPVGAPGAVVVSLGCWFDPGAFTAATYGGQALTAHPDSPVVSTNVRVYMWYLLNPPAGVQNVVLTWTNSGLVAYGCISALYASSAGAHGKGTNGSGDPTVTLASGAGLLIDGALADNNPTSLDVGADQTKRCGQTIFNRKWGMSSQPGPSNGIMSWTSDGVNSGVIALELRGGGAGPRWFI